jgi:hypothetical protein
MQTYIPDAKALVYQELNFISTAVGLKTSIAPSYDDIFDEVSQEIYNEFVVTQQERIQPIHPAQTVAALFVKNMLELLN